MTGPEIQATYFSPLMYFFYLFMVLCAMIAYYQWSWTQKCNKNVKVLVVQPDGSTDTEYAPKSAGYVALRAPASNTTKLWPINKLSAIEMMYPGDGFIPSFFQKKIKTVIVDAEDWEPLLNRGSYTERVASPDVVEVLRNMADKYPKMAADLTDLADSLSTAPTRDMVASPAVLGNIMNERVSEMAITISKDTFDKLSGITNALAKMPNAMVIYIGLGVTVILLAVVLFKVLPVVSGLQQMQGAADKLQSITDGVNAIKRSLGVP